MSYRGYSAKVEVDTDAGLLHGEVADISDVVTFQAESVPDLRREFEAAVDDYLEFCRERGTEPQKPYSGRFVVRIEPELHRAAAVAAKHAGESLNAFVAGAVRDAVDRGARGAGAEPEEEELYSAILRVIRESPRERASRGVYARRTGKKPGR